MGRPISYEMQMMFVGSSGAFEESMNTGSGISRLDFIQGYDFSFNIERTPLKQIGSDSFATRQTQLAPDVNLNIQYYLNDGWNDKYIGLDIPTGTTGNPFDSILSSTGDRNFYISIAQNDGIDQNLQTGIVNSNILAIGNAYITNYEISVAVNQLATVSCSFVGANANVQDYATSKYLPSVNTLVSGQNAQDANKNFSLNFVNNSRTERYLPKATEVFDGGCPYSKCKITPDFQSGGGTSPITFGFFDAIANNFQSMQFSVGFERKALYGFGNNHPYTRKIQRPTVATLTLSALIDDFQAENLSKVFHAEGGTQKSMLIEFFNFQDVKKFGLSLQNLTLESYNLGARIGDRVLVETNWSVEVKNGAGADIGMIGSYGSPLLDATKVNESFAIERLFYQMNADRLGGTVAIDFDNRTFNWGSAQDSVSVNLKTVQTPREINTKRIPFEKIVKNYGTYLTLDKNGQAWAWGANTWGETGINISTILSIRSPVKVCGNKTFCEISNGTLYSVAIDKNGKAWAWGRNLSGTVGNGNFDVLSGTMTPAAVVGNNTFCKIQSGYNHVIALDKNGKVWSWGVNSLGQLGVSGVFSLASPVQVYGGRTFCKINAGEYHSFAIDKYGKAWAWGYNQYGVLGDSTIVCKTTPVAVAGGKTFCEISGGWTHSLAIDKYGKAWAWGYNHKFQLGAWPSAPQTSVLSPVSVYGSKTFCKIFAGYYFSLAVDKYNRAWAWGWNDTGSIGNGNSFKVPNLLKEFSKTFCKINVGTNAIIALDQNKKLWTWGRNTFGVLGTGGAITDDFASPVAICSQKTFCQISFKRNHVMAIDNYGTVWGWGLNGSNNRGAVGINSAAVCVTTPTQIYGNKTFCKISAGSTHTSGIDKNGMAWSWGDNSVGQLGSSINAFTTNTTCTPVAVAGGKTFCEISAGGVNTLALDNNGRIWAWGDYIILGEQYNRTNTASPISVSHSSTFCKIYCGTRYAYAIDNKGYLWSWGSSIYGLGNGSLFSYTPVLITTQAKYSVTDDFSAIDENGGMWSWGSSSYGTLGDGTYGRFASQCRTAMPLYLANKTFCQISKSDALSVALDSQGKVWAWGRSNTKIGNLTYNEVTPVRVYNI